MTHWQHNRRMHVLQTGAGCCAHLHSGCINLRIVAPELCLALSAQRIGMSALLYSRETWTVGKPHIYPLAIFQMNCLRRICDAYISLHDHASHVVVLNRCNIFCMESELQSKRLRWSGYICRLPNDRLLEKLYLVKSRFFVNRTALGLVSITLHYVTVNTIVLVGLKGVHKTDCSGETRLVLHVPSSS